MDHATEDQPIRLADVVSPSGMNQHEGLRCGRYENIDDIESVIELRAEYVHGELEFSPN